MAISRRLLRWAAGCTVSLALTGPALPAPADAVPDPEDAAPGDTAPRAYTGRPLVEVLRALQEQGVNLIYSSAVVTPDLVVTVEPTSRAPRRLLEEILPSLGLEARPGPGRSLLIVALPRPLPPGRLAGRVISTVLGTAVEGATVTVVENGRRTATGQDGSYTFEELEPGVYTLAIQAPWFAPLEVPGVRIDPARTRRLLTSLGGEPGYVEEVVVTPSRLTLVQQEPAPGLTFDREDTVLVPSIGNDVSRIIQILPGMAAADTSAAFSVRGSLAKDVSLVLDGLELYEPFHLEGFQSPFSFIDNDLVAQVDILRGGFTAEAGDRNGGFVLLSTVNQDAEYHTTLEAGTIRSRISHIAPTAHGAFLISARAWYPEALNGLNLGAESLDPRFQDVYLKYAHNVSPTTLISGHLLLAGDDLQYVESDGAEEVVSDNTSAYAWVRLLHQWSPRATSDTILSGGRLRRLREGISEPEDAAQVVDDRRRVQFYGLRHEQTWEVSGRQLVKAGFGIRPLKADYFYVAGDPNAPDTTSLAPQGTAYTAHAAYRAVITPRFAAEAGLRWDKQSYVGDRQLSPRLNAIWETSPRSRLRLGWGYFYQSQRIYELDVEDGETAFQPAELSRQSELTFQYSFASGLGLRVDAYSRRLSQVQSYAENLFNPIELFPETEADRVVIAPQKARAWGVEFLLRGKDDRPLAWWVSYAWSRVEDIIDGQAVRRSWDQTHAGNFLLAYTWSGRWTTALTGTVHTGWPTTPIYGTAVTQPDGSIELEPVLGPRNSLRFDTYARLDLRVGRAIELSRGRLLLELQVTNLTDRKNQCCVEDAFLTQQPDGSVSSTLEYSYWLGRGYAFTVAWQF